MNYQNKTDDIINEITAKNVFPKLLLHCCCAPCSSYVLEYLSEFFEITLAFYNPNISPYDEYLKRLNELKKFVDKFPAKKKISFIEVPYENEKFVEISKGLEKLPEGSKRCFSCYRLRLEETAKLAKQYGFDYFTTTLSISPFKNASKLNEIGSEFEQRYNVSYLYSDFKKKNGYKRSIELSKEYDLYRQDYCGCIYSKQIRMNKVDL